MAKQRVNITLPKELLDTLRHLAEQEYRSLSAEIEYLLTNLTPTYVNSTPALFTTPAPQPPFEPVATTKSKKSTITPAPERKTPVDEAIEWLDTNQIDIFSTDPTAYVQAFPTQNATVFDDAQSIRRQKSRQPID